MFGFLKKKKEAPAPDPEAARMAARVNEQTQIAELQSQVAELRRQSTQMNAEIAKKVEERRMVMAEIQAAPQAQKISLALRVQNIDQYVARLNNSLALIEQQIGNNEAVILQKGINITVDTGDVGNVVDIKQHQEQLQQAAAKKDAGDTNIKIAEDMANELTGEVSALTGGLADIIAEAEGTSQAVSPDSVAFQPPDAAPPPRSMPASQY